MFEAAVLEQASCRRLISVWIASVQGFAFPPQCTLLITPWLNLPASSIGYGLGNCDANLAWPDLSSKHDGFCKITSFFTQITTEALLHLFITFHLDIFRVGFMTCQAQLVKFFHCTFILIFSRSLFECFSVLFSWITFELQCFALILCSNFLKPSLLAYFFNIFILIFFFL